jgi:hypothetical protein
LHAVQVDHEVISQSDDIALFSRVIRVEELAVPFIPSCSSFSWLTSFGSGVGEGVGAGVGDAVGCVVAATSTSPARMSIASTVSGG